MKSNIARNQAAVLARNLSLWTFSGLVAIALLIVVLVGVDRLLKQPAESLLVFGLPTVLVPILAYLRLRVAIPDSVTIVADTIRLDFGLLRRTKIIGVSDVLRLDLREPMVWHRGSMGFRWVHLHWRDTFSRRRKLVFPVGGEAANSLTGLRARLGTR